MSLSIASPDRVVRCALALVIAASLIGCGEGALDLRTSGAVSSSGPSSSPAPDSGSVPTSGSTEPVDPSTPADPIASPTNPAPPVANPSPPVANPTPSVVTDTVVQLGWQPNVDTIAGYVVYYGATASGATTVASQLPLTSNAFNAQAPAISYYAKRDLNLNPGSAVCFRLRAYNSGGTYSDYSQAACGTI